MAVLINGKKIANKILEDIKQEVLALEKKPTLAVIIVGEDPASKIYVRMKKENAIASGMNSIVIELLETTTQQVLEAKIDELNNDIDINGILVQLPLPKQINSYEIIERIKPEKDVDGFHPINVGRLAIGIKPYAKSCTPAGIIRLLEEYNISIEGKNAVVIGRSNIVGKPMATMLLEKNATVTIAHSRTNNLESIVKQADIIVSAVGIAKLVKSDWVKQGAVVIDVGMNRSVDGKLCGDVDFVNVEPKCSYITPVPGGVGPMTRAMLLLNTLELYKIQNNL